MKKIAVILMSVSMLWASGNVALEVEGVLDNREYFNKFEEPGTVFGFQETGTGSVEIGKGSLTAGIVWFQEFGSPIEEWPAAPILYYQYNGDKGGRFLFGSFKRNSNLLYSQLLIDQRYDRRRPQVEGFDYRYTFPKGAISIWMDWDSRQTSANPEHFFVGISGKEKFGKFGIEEYFLYRHLAGRDVPLPHDPVGETGGGHLILSYENNDIQVLDTLKSTVELLGSYNRTDRSDDWNDPVGVQVTAKTIFHRLGLSGSYYKGLYESRNWHQLDQGAPLYNAPEFGQIDFAFYPVQKENISMKFHWTTTFVDGVVENQQNFILSGTIRKDFKKEELQ